VTAFQRIQLEQASRGCVSGTLEEWPALRQAFFQQGVSLPLYTDARTMMRVAQALLSELGK
jgi:hypothetical protein